MGKTYSYRDQQIADVLASQRTSPTPEIVREGKRLLEAGVRLPARPGPRPWYCRSCGHAETAEVIPTGWYALSRHPGNREERALRLGLYCSAACVEAQMPRLLGVEADAGASWRDAPLRQVPTERMEGDR